MMKKLTINVFILLAFSLLNATIIHIPADYPAIQEGINASVDGDTVLVADGVYYENLSIDREITLASHFIIDGNISHRDSTIIDGSNYDEELGPFGSCVLFRPPENGDAISPKLTGFTIQHGLGTRVREIIETSDGDITITYYMGGGLMIWYTLPEITYNYIRNNGSESDTRAGSTKRGGANGLINSDDVEFDEDRSEPYDRTLLTRDDLIIFTNNIFENNDSETGNTFESIEFEGEVDFSYSVFDVFASGHEDVSDYWIAIEEATTDFTGGSGALESINYGVWVSPDGVDESITTGTEQDPFKTIDYAMSRSYATESDPITINLTEGTFSPSTTGETFPITMISNINLIGQGEEVTIIDAEETDRLIIVEDCENNIISNITITGGLLDNEEESFVDSSGGGIFIKESNPTLTNVTISGNSSSEDGGGVFLFKGDPILTNVTISGNSVVGKGGGIFLFQSSPTLTNVMITGNSSSEDGAAGIYIKFSDPTLTDVTISDNISFWDGGGMTLYHSNPMLTNVTVSGNESGNYAGGIFLWGSNPTLTDVIITGNSSDDDGGGLYLINSSPTFTDVTISGNSAEGGGGIYSVMSTLLLTNVTISGNSADDNSPWGDGGGIYLNTSSILTLSNSIIWNNNPESIYLAGNATVNAVYSDIEGGWEEGEGNIDADPMFTDPENGYYALQAGSPCIDAGTADLDGDGVDDITDFVGSAPDMGAFEFVENIPSTISVEYLEGWNIVGLPLYVEDASYDTLFSDAVNGTLYGYEGSYYGSDVLEAGNGYWLVFTNAGSAEISGEEITNLTISLSEGWNLIAGISSPVAVESISDPGDIIVSGTIYGYGGSYYNADAIEPGKGYWLNAFADGEVTFGEGLARSRPVFEDMTAGANTLTINGQDLYFGIDIPADKMMSYSLPPKPPSGAFDVRFSGDTKIAMDKAEIEVINPSQTLTISYDVVLDAGDHMSWILISESGEEYTLESTGEITIPTEETFTLERKAIIPISYTLHQNFPNPFNPITSLRYDLPEQAQVTLTVYDLMGREVTQLVNTTQEPGFKSVRWDATDRHGKPVSAGVYLYQIQAGEFLQTRKMVLLK
jgi:predicted outer membrane repeat protein